MESEQSQNFNERLSQWVASQGLWFQVRYSMASQGVAGRAAFHLLRLGLRILIFLLIVAAGGWVYLFKRTESKNFSEGMKSTLQAGLVASEIEMRGFSRARGQLGIKDLACQGGEGTFFTSMEARNVSCKMGLFDGLIGPWNPGTIALSRLDMELRAGADDAESAQMISKALFWKSDKVLIESLEVADASFHWGYSERTRGEIRNSALKVQRTENGLKLVLSGGKFSQNWLSDLDIVSLVIVCDPNGLFFEKAEFRQGLGTIDFSGLKVVGGERPSVDGTAKVRRLSLDTALPAALKSFVEGSISGNFRVSGSTNTREGIGFAGQVVLDGRDVISVRERLHLLKALSVVDYVRNYHRLDFREGSFQLQTTAGGMEVTNLSLKADDLFSLDGKMRVRLPTPEEAKESVAKSGTAGGMPLFNGAESGEPMMGINPQDADFTLRRAAQEAKRAREGGASDGTISLFERLARSVDIRRLEEQAAERLSRTLRYEGLFKITLPGDAFERAPKLAAQFPVDGKLGRIPMEVPIEGSLYEMTLKQAEDVYQQGAR